MKFEYDILLSDDIITIIKQDETYFDIIASDYWKWIKDNRMNHYCNDYYEPREYDGHGQVVGKYSMEEYFNLPYSEIKQDLSKYLLESKFKKHL